MKENLKKTIYHWLKTISETEKIPTEIVALNFNLSEPYAISLVGSFWYDDEDQDWACDEDFVPEQMFCPEFYIPKEVNWEEVLNLITQILKELLTENPDWSVFLVEHIAVGFVDGDLVKIK